MTTFALSRVSAIFAPARSSSVASARRARKQRGNALIYTAVAGAVLAAGGYFGYGWYKDESIKTTIQQDIQNAADAAQNSQQMFGASPAAYTGQTTATLVQAGAIPRRLRVGVTNTAQNAFNQNITAAPANGTGTNDLLVYTWPVTPVACARMVSGIEKFSRRVVVGATTVKALDGALAPATVGPACDNGAATVNILFAVGQNPSVVQ